jgi:hypothetical protein
MRRVLRSEITFAELRDMGVRGVLIYCADYRCSHSIAVSADHWPDDLKLSDLEPHRQFEREFLAPTKGFEWACP